ncbi:unnamed protein product [Lymnaea stagnalis]|uniref:AP complex subunit sigma n=1 Tax=Lymnaea stagnalis TaxID=6523 RepID=A0AAV2H2J5_LYMST
MTQMNSGRTSDNQAMILFCLIVNKQGRVRLRRNYQHIEEKERDVRDSLIISKCLTRTKKQCSFFSYDGMTIIYKSFTTLTLICGVTKDENELSIQELLNVFMDCLGSYFQHVSEMDVSFCVVT